MWTTFYVFTIGFVSAPLFLMVNEFEPDRRLAVVLKFLVLALGAAALARQLLGPSWCALR
jgi:hypothetical protein